MKEDDQPEEVVHTLSNLKAPLNSKKLRQPSFFQKMFSSSKLNRVHSEYFAFPESEVQNTKEYFHEADGDGISGKRSRKEKKNRTKDIDDMDMDTIATDEQDKRLVGDGDEQKDYSSSSTKSKKGKRSRRKSRDNLSEISEDMSGEDEKRDNSVGDTYGAIEATKPKYPVMPTIGKPVNIDRLVNRTKAAAAGIRYLMEMVENDVIQSIQRAKAIPVSKELDRVQVTPQISAVAAKVRSTAQVKKVVDSNMIEIQRNLNYRKSALIMMNVNYANQRVRKIDPIYVQEARTIVTYK